MKTTKFSGSIESERQPQTQPSTSPGVNHDNVRSLWDYETIDSELLARRLCVSESWIRDQVRARAEDPIPHLRLGKYVRFLWGSPELEAWLRRRIVGGNNRRVERVQ